MAHSARTPERRAQQAEAIRQWQPWASSTGPRTEKGKAAVAQNAFKGEGYIGTRQFYRLMAKYLREQQQELREIQKQIEWEQLTFIPVKEVSQER